MINIPFKNSLLSWIFKKRIYQIDFFKKHPHEAQKKIFFDLIKQGKNSLFGQDHHFQKINSYVDFCHYVPVRTYEELFPYIDQIRRGKKNILWPGKVKWFAKSSGTTNDRSKYIPISIDSLKKCHFKGGKDMLSLYCTNYPKTNIYNGKGLMIGGSQDYNDYYDFTEGDLSAILMRNFPFWVNIHRTPDLKTALMKDWEKKLHLICKQSIKEDVTNITGVPSWVLIVLNKILKETSSKNILEVWPNLELYMHGGISFGPYKDRFAKIIPMENMNYLEGYNASEGFFGIQDQKNEKDLLLMLDYGIFYEFILFSDYNKGLRDTIPLSNVCIGEIYVLVISTNAGLWRYIIGDTIRFTSINPYRIKIVGRTHSYINAFGEEIMVENAEQALKMCCDKHNCSVDNFIVAPKFNNSGSGFHRWIIEFTSHPNSILKFKSDLDIFLRDINSDYDQKRKNDFVLKELEIIIARDNLFYRWLNNNNRLGGQYKVPRLDNSAKIFNDIMLLNQV